MPVCHTGGMLSCGLSYLFGFFPLFSLFCLMREKQAPTQPPSWKQARLCVKNHLELSSAHISFLRRRGRGRCCFWNRNRPLLGFLLAGDENDPAPWSCCVTGPHLVPTDAFSCREGRLKGSKLILLVLFPATSFGH